MSLTRQDTPRTTPYALFGCPPPIELQEDDVTRIDGDYYIILDILNSSGDPICANIQQPLIGNTAKFDIPKIFRGLKVMRSTIEDISTLQYVDGTGLQEFILQFTGYWSDNTTSGCERLSQAIDPISIQIINYLDLNGDFDDDSLTHLVLTNDYERRICGDSIINIPVYHKSTTSTLITASFNGTLVAQQSVSGTNQIHVLRTDFANWTTYNPSVEITTGTLTINVGGTILTFDVDQQICCLPHNEIFYLNDCGQYDFVLAKSVKDKTIDLRGAEVSKNVDCRSKLGGLITAVRTRADKIESVVIESCDEDHIEEFLTSLKKIIFENGEPVEVRNADSAYVIFRKNSRTFINYRYVKTVSKIPLSQ